LISHDKINQVARQGSGESLFFDEYGEKEVHDALEEVREIKAREGKSGGAG